jgi:predicted transcriptional regulator
MDIQAEINWIHQEIDKVKDPNFIEKMKHLLQSINTPTDTTVAEYNADIDNSLKSIEKGNFYTEEEAKEISKKWGRK